MTDYYFYMTDIMELPDIPDLPIITNHEKNFILYETYNEQSFIRDYELIMLRQEVKKLKTLVHKTYVWMHYWHHKTKKLKEY